MEAINREKCCHGRFGMENGSNQPREVLSRSIRNGKWKQSTERSVITVDLEWKMEAINREKCYHGRFGMESGSNQPRKVLSRSIRKRQI
ncbi:hypothetical protein MHI02_07700 [Oceanobacillus sp. FSL K6-0118]|uniref:hypothetical protein n=1 Tax=Oceanobacillus sp. FSL K6-0118 TaxID=2921418 RepID=UPI0030F621E8